jgi:hypothetical protein
MRRSQSFGVALVIVAGLGALTAAPALAEILLAEWLVNGALVTTELTAEITEELTLEDTKTAVGIASVKCSDILDGWIGPNGLSYATEVLSLSGIAAGALLTGAGITCTAVKGCEANTPPLYYPTNIPWFYIDYYNPVYGFYRVWYGTGGPPDWAIVCLVLGISIEDDCQLASEGEPGPGLTLEGSTLLANFSTEITELLGGVLETCTQGGKEAGVITGSGAFTLSGGGELTASVEAIVS